MKLLSMALSVLLLAGTAQAYADTIGTVDVEKVLRGYEQYQSFTSDQKVKEADLRKLQADYAKQLEESKAASSKSPITSSQLEKDLTQRLGDQVKAYQEWATKRQDELERSLDGTIQAVAKGKGVDVVLTKQVVYQGGLDMTADVIRQLNAKATPATVPAGK